MNKEPANKKPADFVLPRIRNMRAYQPGLQMKDRSVIKLNTNESPFPPFKSVKREIERALSQNRLHLYPDPQCRELRRAIARKYGLKKENVMIGNGSDEILSLLFRTLLAPAERVLLPQPTYSLYPTLAAQVGAEVVEIALKEDWRIDFPAAHKTLTKEKTEQEKREQEKREQAEKTKEIKLALIANPNAPTGIAERSEDILAFASSNPALTLIDEAYSNFCGQSVAPHLRQPEYSRLLVSGTFSKAYGLAGLRVGWLAANPDLIAELDKMRDSYNVNLIGQAAALAALQNEALLQKRIDKIKKRRLYLTEKLDELGFQTLPSAANFIFTHPPSEVGSASDYQQYLQEAKILVRYFPEDRCREFVRISIGRKRELKKLIAQTKSWMNQSRREKSKTES